MIKNFSIFKNHKKEKDTHPDYTISAKVVTGNTDEFKEIGAVYLKDSTKGEKYFSCSLSKTREWDGKTISGYVIVNEVQYEKMKQVYDDYLIKGRLPDYPTPTEQGIDLTKTLQPDPAFDNVPEITPEMLGDIPF